MYSFVPSLPHNGSLHVCTSLHIVWNKSDLNPSLHSVPRMGNMELIVFFKLALPYGHFIILTPRLLEKSRLSDYNVLLRSHLLLIKL